MTNSSKSNFSGERRGEILTLRLWRQGLKHEGEPILNDLSARWEDTFVVSGTGAELLALSWVFEFVQSPFADAVCKSIQEFIVTQVSKSPTRSFVYEGEESPSLESAATSEGVAS